MQLDKHKKYYVCTNETCQAKEKACPVCSKKLLIKFNKSQNNRPFMGCSGYGSTGCTYSENL